MIFVLYSYPCSPAQSQEQHSFITMMLAQVDLQPEASRFWVAASTAIKQWPRNSITPL